MTVEYWDEDGDLADDVVTVEADDATAAQDAFLDDVTGFLDDADEMEHDAHVIQIKEADE